MFQIEKKSKLYDTVLKERQLADKIPIPNVIKRHLLVPQSGFASLELNAGSEGNDDEGNIESRITGFRIQVKGRSGSRSTKKVVSYGYLANRKAGAINGSMVDYGYAQFTDPKRGTTGVKVWIGYK